MKTHNIIVSAYSCEPLSGSEPAVGWNFVIELAKSNRVHVITRANNQSVIEQHFPKEVKENLIFHYYDTPAIIRNLKKKEKRLYFYNFCWQIGILNVAKKIIKNENIDYTIHLTFGSMWMPTFLPLLKTPFIWGPIGGGECVPKSFLKILPLKQKLIQAFRYFLNATTLFNPFIMVTAWRAVAILARTPETLNVIPRCFRKKTRVLLETAMEESIFKYEKKNYDVDKVHVILSARLISVKNIPVAIRSLRYIKTSKKWDLTIIGSGPDLDLIKREIDVCGYRNIEIIPFMPRNEVLQKIVSSDIFLFPSLKEGGSWALMEAMAMGLPVICVNCAGMAVETTPQTAIQIPVTNPKHMELDMGNALGILIEDSTKRKELGLAARKRIREVFNWENKGKYFKQLFTELDAKKLCRK